MLKNLPLELLQLILRNVVHIRGALETVMTTQFEWIEWNFDEKEKYAESISNRLSLVQVCKAWYSPALELLYEDIRLQSLEKMESLRRSLEESTQGDSELRRGWWTKRLDLPQTIIADSLLEPLITHFPNLRILLFPNMDSVPYRFRNSLPKLRYTHLQLDDGVHIPTDLDTLFLILSIGHEYTFSDLTALQIFFNCEDPSILQGYSFPKIQHLTVSNNVKEDLPTITTFLRRYGQQLLSLHIDSEEICLHVEELLCNTPNIRELIFVPPEESAKSHYDRTFPSVTHIGLVGTWRWNDLADSFCNISRFPNLKCIRMIDIVFRNLEGYMSRFKAWYSQNRPAGVRYEDAERNLLSDVIDTIKKDGDVW